MELLARALPLPNIEAQKYLTAIVLLEATARLVVEKLECVPEAGQTLAQIYRLP
jgi:hypothetical protein